MLLRPPEGVELQAQRSPPNLLQGPVARRQEEVVVVVVVVIKKEQVREREKVEAEDHTKKGSRRRWSSS